MKPFQENIDYTIAPDPTPGASQDDWCVILRGPYDDLVGKFINVEILDKGHRLVYDFEVLHVPDGMEMGDDYDEYLKKVLMSILHAGESNGTLVYATKGTE